MCKYKQNQNTLKTTHSKACTFQVVEHGESKSEFLQHLPSCEQH